LFQSTRRLLDCRVVDDPIPTPLGQNCCLAAKVRVALDGLETSVEQLFVFGQNSRRSPDWTS